jgi:Ca2+-binding RTX toxin-like protein
LYWFGTPGDDTITSPDVMGGTADIMYGGAGNDTINAENQTDAVYGGSGNDTIHGGPQVDTLYGGSGNDTIDGDEQADVIIGGYGADNLTGGTSGDKFVYLSVLDSRPGAGKYDTVTDFTPGQDQFDFSAIDADTATPGVQHFTSVSNTNVVEENSINWYYDAGLDETIIQADVTGDTTADMEIHLVGNKTLQTTDFILSA